MRVALAALSALTLMGAACAASGARAAGYDNPVLPGFHPDPSVCRVGADYYLVTSSFEYFPGVPVFHSRDLAHWRQIGHALTRASQAPLAGVASSQGIYAATLRCHGGQFYVITTNMTAGPGGGRSFYVHASDPAGPWSEPVQIGDDDWGMDPSLFFDDDGAVYYTRHGGKEHGGIYQARLDLASGKLQEQPRLIWKGTGGAWPEGPHLYKVNGWYYLMIAEGGTSYEHAVTVARSRSPWGPFEPAPANPVLTHRDRPELPLQATGHGDLVQAENGSWWMVLLGVRAQQRQHHLGRETLLAPVTWDRQGWPVVNAGRPLQATMSAAGLPPASPWPAPPVRDDFSQSALALQWTQLRGPGDGLWSLSERPGMLRLKGGAAGLDGVAQPAFVARRQEHLAMRAAALVDFTPARDGQAAGLVLRQNENNYYALRIAGVPRRVELLIRTGGVSTVRASAALEQDAGPVTLQVESSAARYRFSYGQGQGAAPAMRVIGEAPAAALSSERAGGFTGVLVGLYAEGGIGTDRVPAPPADVDWFDYQPLPDVR